MRLFPVFVFVSGFLATLGAACRFGGSNFRRDTTAELETEVREADRYSYESRTLSNLAVIEKGLGEYVKVQGQIPESLDLLVPKFLAEIPEVELAVRGHRDSLEVKLYSPSVIRDGVLDGSVLQDSGHWGYTYNDHQVIIFVDCTHINSRGRPWYKERGVF